MTNQEVIAALGTLWGDVAAEQTFPGRRPLLAHYTSLGTLELIMKNDQVWFSNPLYMNDFEELRFGMNEGASAFRVHTRIREACRSASRYEILLRAFDQHFHEFDVVHAFDTYVLCFSEHERDNNDGLLSMWRGYGGNGSGVAIVLNTANVNVVPDSPIIISHGSYASRDTRLAWIAKKLDEFAGLLTLHSVADDQLSIAAYMILERLKFFALFTKHHGFAEEREWRAVYLSQRDLGRRLTPMLDYAIGQRGIEPKLKFIVRPIEGLTAADLSLDKLVERIILGPSLSNSLAVSAVKRMLTKVGKDAMISKVVASTTPFRNL
jgi:hypothetical protein